MREVEIKEIWIGPGIDSVHDFIDGNAKRISLVTIQPDTLYTTRAGRLPKTEDNIERFSTASL